MGKLISFTAEVLPGAKIGEGSIVFGSSCLSVDVIVGNNVLIMGGVGIGHDAVIKENSVTSYRVFIGGCTVINENAYLGPNALIRDRVNVGAGAVVSLGAVILRNVKPKSIMVGNPAKIIGVNNEDTVFKRF